MARAQQGPVTVRVAPVEKRAVELTRPLVATVEPVTETKLAAEQEGLVVERHFDEGGVVGKDEVMVRLDTALLKAQREAAAADAEALEAQVEQARLTAENAQRESNRLRGLFEGTSIPEKEFLDARTTARAYDAAVKARKAELAARRAEVARLDLMIRKSDVRAPIGKGIVARRYVEVGQWLKQGDPVADLVWLDPVFIRTNVPEGVISKVHKGDEVRIIVDALGDTVLIGKVDQIIPTADPNSRTFPVKVLLANPKGEVRPGFFARATFLANTAADQFVVPKDAVVTSPQGSHVVAAREGKAVIVPVKRGGAAGELMTVGGDLKEGDQVVTRGNEALRGGEALQILPSAPGVPPGGGGAPGGGAGGKSADEGRPPQAGR